MALITLSKMVIIIACYQGCFTTTVIVEIPTLKTFTWVVRCSSGDINGWTSNLDSHICESSGKCYKACAIVDLNLGSSGLDLFAVTSEVDVEATGIIG
jgi:hypothetical protein